MDGKKWNFFFKKKISSPPRPAATDNALFLHSTAPALFPACLPGLLALIDFPIQAGLPLLAE